MVLFSFVGGAAVYRANLHMAVVALLQAVNERTRKVMLALVDLCMLATALFMLGYGAHLVIVTWHQVIAEFSRPVRRHHLPAHFHRRPDNGVLYHRARLVRRASATSIMYSDQPLDLE